MQEKTYLKWYNKVGYGSGDIAGNVVYAFLSSFVMIYLTNTIGLSAGIVGTLIAVSKLFDGFTDIFFGTMIDKTHSKLGKARPWMLYGYVGCAVTLAAIFAIPVNWGEKAQYAWFFIAYTLLNGVFYTANNIAYSALTSLVTKNSKERVQMGSYRFIFAFSTSLLIQSVTIGLVAKCGGLEDSSHNLCGDRSGYQYGFCIIRKRASGRGAQRGRGEGTKGGEIWVGGSFKAFGHK